MSEMVRKPEDSSLNGLWFGAVFALALRYPTGPIRNGSVRQYLRDQQVRALWAAGWTGKAIARELGCDAARVRKIRNRLGLEVRP